MMLYYKLRHNSVMFFYIETPSSSIKNNHVDLINNKLYKKLYPIFISAYIL